MPSRQHNINRVQHGIWSPGVSGQSQIRDERKSYRLPSLTHNWKLIRGQKEHRHQIFTKFSKESISGIHRTTEIALHIMLQLKKRVHANPPSPKQTNPKQSCKQTKNKYCKWSCIIFRIVNFTSLSTFNITEKSPWSIRTKVTILSLFFYIFIHPFSSTFPVQRYHSIFIVGHPNISSFESFNQVKAWIQKQTILWKHFNQASVKYKGKVLSIHAFFATYLGLGRRGSSQTRDLCFSGKSKP